MVRPTSIASLVFAVLASVSLFAQPETRRAVFDPSVGPNEYTIVFPPEISDVQVAIPITGGSFEIETDGKAGTARLTTWRQDLEAIDLFGMNTGPITVTLDETQPSSGTFDATTGEFSVTGVFEIAFDDSQLRQLGFVSPVSLQGTEEGIIHGVGNLGTISMFLAGEGLFQGGTFSYTCRTTARIEDDLFENQAQTGDVNRDRSLDVSDAVSLLQDLFGGLEAPCAPAGEVNGDEDIDLSDAVFLLNFLFSGGPPPSAEVVTCGDASV